MKHKKVKIKFAFLPIVYHNKTYWWEWVETTKHFNGYRFVTTNIEKL